MDPSTIATAATIVGKLISAGLGGWKASKEEGFSDKEFDALKNFVDLGGGLVSLRKAPEAKLQARLLALTSAAFGEALRRHWAYSQALAPSRVEVKWRDWLFKSGPDRARMDELATRVRQALSRPFTPGDKAGKEELPTLDALLGNPLNLPYYQRLFHAFTDPALDTPEMLPILGREPHAKRELERHFLLAFHEGLATRDGRELRDYLLGLTGDRIRLVRELLIADTASWRRRHVFGNVENHALLPEMPLDEMYVQPGARVGQVQGEQPQLVEPVLALVQRCIDEHPIVLVTADFGHGKSLTARTLAWQWAHDYLSDRLESSSKLTVPVFIKCAEDFTAHQVDLEQVVRRALQRQASGFGLELKTHDPALAMPPDDQKTVFLLDGLDEVALSERELEELFRQLHDHASSDHRFVVFSRPQAIPRELREEKYPVIEVQPLSTDIEEGAPSNQVADWLKRWNRLTTRTTPINVSNLVERGVLELAAVPILLFMIAQTWDEHGSAGATHAALYETFFRQVARGKHEHDRDEHPQVFKASERLRKVLVERRELDKKAPASEAMLWLMARVAWKARQVEEYGETLDSYHIDKIIRDELQIPQTDSVARTIRIGLLFTLQADLEGNRHRMLFGHKSFQEYLVATWWARRIRLLIKPEGRDPLTIERSLYGAGIVQSGDRTIEFLMQILNGWNEGDRKRVFQWASDCFNSERLEPDPARSESPAIYTLRGDIRYLLRNAALAVGSLLKGFSGVTAVSKATLQTMLSSFALHNDGSDVFVLRAPGLNSPKAQLNNFEGFVDLPNANLHGANMFRSFLVGANFAGANLRDANLWGCILDEADMNSANLEKARLTDSECGGASFLRARFCGTYLNRALLDNALFREADLSDADLSDADLSGATLADALLLRANLRGAILHNCDLTRANLTDARLDGADFMGANLTDAVLNGVNFDLALNVPVEVKARVSKLATGQRRKSSRKGKP